MTLLVKQEKGQGSKVKDQKQRVPVMLRVQEFLEPSFFLNFDENRDCEFMDLLPHPLPLCLLSALPLLMLTYCFLSFPHKPFSMWQRNARAFIARLINFLPVSLLQI